MLSFSKVRQRVKMPPHRPNKDLPCIKISCTFWSLSQPFTSSWSWGLSLNTGFWLSTSSLKTATSTSKWWNVFESKKPRKLRNNQTDTDDGFSANGAPCSSQLQKLITHISLLTWPDIIILKCKKRKSYVSEAHSSQCVRACVSSCTGCC